MQDAGNEVSEENIELVRRLYAELASERSTREFEQRLTDDALGRFLDSEIEWVPVSHSLLAVDSYRGFDGVRRFWGEFLSTWESYRFEPLRFYDAGDQVGVVVRIVGRAHELEVEETRSSLLTIRDGRVVHVQSFANPEGAPEAAGCHHRRNARSLAMGDARQRRRRHQRLRGSSSPGATSRAVKSASIALASGPVGPSAWRCRRPSRVVGVACARSTA